MTGSRSLRRALLERRTSQGGAGAGQQLTACHQCRAVDGFFAAARRGDFEALLTVLDPDVVLRAERAGAAGGVSSLVRGAAEVASRAAMFANPAAVVRLVLNGAAGVVATVDGRPVSLMAFTVSGGRIVEIDAVTDPQRPAELLSA